MRWGIYHFINCRVININNKSVSETNLIFFQFLVIRNKKKITVQFIIFKGFGQEHAYIATQGNVSFIKSSSLCIFQNVNIVVMTFALLNDLGPRQNTVGDFWLMVWQENVSQIVMLTNVMEGKKVNFEVIALNQWLNS